MKMAHLKRSSIPRHSLRRRERPLTAIIAVSPVDARRVFGRTRILVPAEPVMADHLAKVARFFAKGIAPIMGRCGSRDVAHLSHLFGTGLGPPPFVS